MLINYTSWSRDSFFNCHKFFEYVGFLALLAYGFSNLLWPSAGKLVQVFAIAIGVISFFAYGDKKRTSFPVYLLIAALVIQATSWGLGYFNHPEWTSSSPRLDRLGKIFAFIAYAWLLGGSTRNTLYLWGLSAIGFLLATLLQGHATDWLTGLGGQRVDFDMRNAQHTAMFFGTVLLGMTCFSFRIIHHQKRLIPWRFCLWALFTVSSLIGLFITQTRAIWLAITAAMILMALAWLCVRLARNKSNAGKQLALSVGALMLITTSIVWVAKDIVVKRLAAESEVISTVIAGNFADVPYTSVGIRIQTWRAATEWIAERPVFGWGENGRSLAIKETSWLPNFVREDFGHLHNYFLEVWIAYGLVGVGLIAVLAIWIGRGTLQAWRTGVIPNDMALFSLAFFVFWIIVNQFESYNSFGSGVYVFNIILAGLTTHIWRAQSVAQATARFQDSNQ
ncbi:MAG: O-antigen ligase family protein [Gammaproteobacteria bacterium]|nr:O-antigen ligase family protein [Gammaproteobacteria bacterium]